MIFSESATIRFFRFMAERHAMFRRRILDQAPSPWSEDEILNEVYFTNIYRELDRGTRYVINHLIEGRVDLWLTIFNIIAYRAFNVIGTHRLLASVLGMAGPHPRIVSWNLGTARSCLTAAQREGAHIFTGAFLITGSGEWSGRGGKIGLVCENLTKIWRNKDVHARALTKTDALQDAHEYLTTLPGIGAFMAYELVCDFMYRNSRGWCVLPQFTESDWVNMGPGARRGLRVLLGHLPSRLEGEEAIFTLTADQASWFERAGVKLHGPILTLRGIEHSLCEFQKYERAREGGRIKRRFDRREASTDLTPWATLPKKFL